MFSFYNDKGVKTKVINLLELNLRVHMLFMINYVHPDVSYKRDPSLKHDHLSFKLHHLHFFSIHIWIPDDVGQSYVKPEEIRKSSGFIRSMTF